MIWLQHVYIHLLYIFRKLLNTSTRTSDNFLLYQNSTLRCKKNCLRQRGIVLFFMSRDGRGLADTHLRRDLVLNFLISKNHRCNNVSWKEDGDVKLRRSTISPGAFVWKQNNSIFDLFTRVTDGFRRAGCLHENITDWENIESGLVYKNVQRSQNAVINLTLTHSDQIILVMKRASSPKMRRFWCGCLSNDL